MKKILSVLTMLTILVAGCSNGSSAKEATVCKGDINGTITEVTVEKNDKYVKSLEMKMTIDMQGYGIDQFSDDDIKMTKEQVTKQYEGYKGVKVEADINKKDETMVVTLAVDLEKADDLPAQMSSWGSDEDLSKVNYKDFIKEIENSDFECNAK